MSRARTKLAAELEMRRRTGLADLYYFARNILGYKLMVPHVHQRMCEFIMKPMERGENEQATKILLEPRGSFKSTVGTVARTLWELARNPEVTILITNEKLDKSKAFLKEIKSHITDNEVFRMLYGDWSCENMRGRKWSDSRMDIKPRQKQGAAPSVEASSVESSETGKHVDLIIADDLVGKSNSGTPEQLAKIDEYVKDLGAVLNPGGELFFIGTRWDHRDVYNTQFEHIKELGKFARADILIERARREDGTPYFPERLSEQFLRSQRAKLGTYFYSCFPAGTRILGRENKNIEDLEVGDKVFNRDGELVDVEYCHEEFADELMKIRLWGYPDPLYVTPDHSLLTWKSVGYRNLFLNHQNKSRAVSG